ncbi:hypothetical protein B0A78_12135 [Flavobacterium columnare NBRC 100251 = ATCC 23463]|uniref:Phage repressor n=2 Tax=Flavobacterium columnare TaxID=996 RepID=G8X988_FLACA|nr:hypothetical protein [Flavobacterium columnare]AEW85139.1 phage repressor [Flavobacterium columnare ATCC 49512]ANO49085.1 phage repressor [Flavobacterium columnare]APT22915.1 hypothetical protein BU993_09990 [Flavobacterium columnare]MBF6653436.1 hypothetical protein [Flavobacterium columnare]MBF6654507.1 hypothetical protein [Flavobacterium columnare]
MSIQERILQYINYKTITPYKFCKELGFAMGYLDKRGAIRTDNYLKIIEHYKDLNPEWLLKGEGNMLKDCTTEKNINDNEKINYKELAEAREEIINLLKEKINILTEENHALKTRLTK